MATLCPLCNKGNLKIGDANIYCSEKKYNSTTKLNSGCDFHIFLDQRKVYGQVLDARDVKLLVEGQKLSSKKGRVIELDMTNKYFLKITKPEDGDL